MLTIIQASFPFQNVQSQFLLLNSFSVYFLVIEPTSIIELTEVQRESPERRKSQISQRSKVSVQPQEAEAGESTSKT